ncbi:MAG: N-glycosylase/DNA lyase [Candidatus Anstonellales archaeon]
MRKKGPILKEEYRRLKTAIQARISEFESLGRTGNKSLIFAELCFCLLTPQSSAIRANKAIQDLKEAGLLAVGRAEEIAPVIKKHGVRFFNTKAKYIASARNFDLTKVLEIAKRDEREAREFLVRSVKGMGYKEASHFLRNIGFGKTLAILDRHILKNIAREGIMKKGAIPKSLKKTDYLHIEEKLLDFSKEKKIPLPHLDLLLWARETGFIFK